MRDQHWHEQVAEIEAKLDTVADQDAADFLRALLSEVKAGGWITPEQCARFGIPIIKDNVN